MAKSAQAFRTISEVAEWLDVPAHVLRFWESKFTQIKPVKRAGGRRYYRPQDMVLIGGIKTLLHDEGMTIKGAQKVLREKGVKHVSSLSRPLDGYLASELEQSAAIDIQTTPPPSAEVVEFKPSQPVSEPEPKDVTPPGDAGAEVAEDQPDGVLTATDEPADTAAEVEAAAQEDAPADVEVADEAMREDAIDAPLPEPVDPAISEAGEAQAEDAPPPEAPLADKPPADIPAPPPFFSTAPPEARQHEPTASSDRAPGASADPAPVSGQDEDTGHDHTETHGSESTTATPDGPGLGLEDTEIAAPASGVQDGDSDLSAEFRTEERAEPPGEHIAGIADNPAPDVTETDAPVPGESDLLSPSADDDADASHDADISADSAGTEGDAPTHGHEPDMDKAPLADEPELSAPADTAAFTDSSTETTAEETAELADTATVFAEVDASETSASDVAEAEAASERADETPDTGDTQEDPASAPHVQDGDTKVSAATTAEDEAGATDAGVLPAFLRESVMSPPAGTDNEPPDAQSVENVEQHPSPLGADIPADPPLEAELAERDAGPGPLALLARIDALGPAQAAEIAPLLERLRTRLDRP